MKVSRENADHYIWGQKCDGWHLLKSDSLSVIQERIPPGTSENLHIHEKAQQLFFILSGTAVIELEGVEYELNGNESFHVEKGKMHKIKNTSSGDLHFLVISEPMAHGDRINC